MSLKKKQNKKPQNNWHLEGNFQHIVAWSRTPNLCKSHLKPRINKRVRPGL